MELLHDNQVDIAFITETWLSDESNTITFAIREAGYEIEHAYRSKTGGGVAILWKKHHNVKFNFKRKCYDTFQYTNIVLEGTVKMNLFCLYRLQETPVSQFMDDLNELLSHHISKSDTIMLAGDFNFHFDIPELKDVKDLTHLTSSMGLSQFVVGPSHKLGHTLDLVFANKHELDLSVIHPSDLNISDHFPIFFSLPCYNRRIKKAVDKFQCRNIKSIDRLEFSRNLCDSLNDKLQCNDMANVNFRDHYKLFSDCVSEQLDIRPNS